MNVNIKISREGACTLGHPYTSPAECRQGVVLVRITDCPDDLRPATVMRQFEKVVVYPFEDYIPWAAIAGKPQGALVRL